MNKPASPEDLLIGAAVGPRPRSGLILPPLPDETKFPVMAHVGGGGGGGGGGVLLRPPWTRPNPNPHQKKAPPTMIQSPPPSRL